MQATKRMKLLLAVSMISILALMFFLFPFHFERPELVSYHGDVANRDVSFTENFDHKIDEAEIRSCFLKHRPPESGEGFEAEVLGRFVIGDQTEEWRASWKGGVIVDLQLISSSRFKRGRVFKKMQLWESQ
jgi:hypothetical protein